MAEMVLSRRPGRLFYLGLGLLVVVAVVYGFAPTYYLRGLSDMPPLTGLLQVHGFLFSLWLVVFVAQATLVSTRRVGLHRQLGVFGVALAATMIVVGIATALQRGPVNDDPGFIYSAAFFDIAMFAAFVGAAVYTRRTPDRHKRFMVLGTVAIIDAGVARWPVLASMFADSPLGSFVAAEGVTDLFLVVAVAYDIATRRRVHPVYLWGGLALVLSQVVRIVILDTAVWRALTTALVGPG